MPYSRRTVLTGAGAAGLTLAANAALGQSGGSLAYRNVRELTAALAAREISARELTDSCIARIEALDGKLNAVVVGDFDNARAAADEADRALARGERVVACPILATVAFPHDHTEQRLRKLDIDGTPQPYSLQAVWAGVATLTGQPATAVPIGRSPEGLPVGVQIVGPYLEDRTTIAFAGLIEQAFGGFVPPPGYAG